jgi:hypothetical protein
MSDYLKLAKNNLQYAMDADEFFSFRLLLAITSIIYAVLIGWTLITSDSYTLLSPTQDLLNGVMDPHWWMLTYAVHGVFGLTGVLLKARNKIFIIFDSLLGALLWNITSSLMISGFLSEHHNLPPVWAAQIVISIFSIWALIRNKYGS